MVKRNFETEKQGQIEFFKNFKIPYIDDDSILVNNTDGVYHGNILECELLLPTLSLRGRSFLGNVLTCCLAF